MGTNGLDISQKLRTNIDHHNSKLRNISNPYLLFKNPRSKYIIYNE